MSENDSDSDFADIRDYFPRAKFDQMAPLRKLQYRNQRLRYLSCVQEGGLTLAKPKFMQMSSDSDEGIPEPVPVNPNKKRRSVGDSNSSFKRNRKEDSQSTSVVEEPKIRRSARQRAKTTPKENSLQHQSDSDESEEELFPDIKGFFNQAEWAKIPITAKRCLQKAKEKYECDIKEGLSVAPPKFMANCSKVVIRPSSSGLNKNHSNDVSLEQRKRKENQIAVDDTDLFITQPSTSTSSRAGLNTNFSNDVLLEQRRRKEDQSTFGDTDLFTTQASTSTSSSAGLNTYFSNDVLLEQRRRKEDQSTFGDTDLFTTQASTSTSLSAGLNKNHSNDVLLGQRKRKDDEISDSGSDFFMGSPSSSPSVHPTTGLRVEEEASDNESNLENLREDVFDIIKNTLPKLKEDVMRQIADCLINDKGVESMADLRHVHDTWLSPFNLKEIQVSKLIEAFKSSEKENTAPGGEKGKTKKSQKGKPLLRELELDSTDNTASRPAMAEKVTPTGVLDYSINWGDMRNSLLVSLQNKERPSAVDRRSMVEVIGKQVKELFDKSKPPSLKQKTPGRKIYKAIVVAIFKDFEVCFMDVVGGKKVGDGMFSLLDQLETNIENKYRQARPRDQKSYSGKESRLASGILSHMYAPAMSKAEKAAAEQIRIELRAHYSQDTWDWPNIKQKMASSLPLQRMAINPKKRDIKQVMDLWPFLFEFHGMVSHAEMITGEASLTDNFSKFANERLDDFIGFLTTVSNQNVKNVKVMNRMNQAGGGVNRKFLAVGQMLANHFGEDYKIALLGVVPEGTLPHEIFNVIEVPGCPFIVAAGNSVFEAKEFHVTLHDTCLCSGLSAIEAMLYLIVSYFSLGILYPAAISKTLTCIASMMANLTDDSGLVRATTASGAMARNVVRTVQSLEENIRKYVHDLEDD